MPGVRSDCSRSSLCAGLLMPIVTAAGSWHTRRCVQTGNLKPVVARYLASATQRSSRLPTWRSSLANKAIRRAFIVRRPGSQDHSLIACDAIRCSKTTRFFTCRSAYASRANGAWVSAKPSAPRRPAPGASRPTTERYIRTIDQPTQPRARVRASETLTATPVDMGRAMPSSGGYDTR